MPAHAQVRCPPTASVRLCQDELDLQARANVVQGSGARAFGMGGAFLARADDATAASWNPAGLSYLRFPEVSIVWGARSTLDSTETKLDGTSVATDRRHGHAPDFLALTYPFERGSISGAAQISYQRVIPFSDTRTIVRGDQNFNVDTSGGFDVLALGTGLQLSRRLRLGATFNRWLNGYDQHLNKVGALRHTLQDTKLGLSGWNVHLGLIWSPWESLNLGAVAKTAFTAKVRLDRLRSDTDGSGDTAYNTFISPDVSIDFPGAFGVGTSWRPMSQLTLSADYTQTYWSRGRIHNFFTLERRLSPGSPAPPPVKGEDLFDTLPYPTLFQSNQTDTEQLRVGAEYVLILGSVKVPLRIGFVGDRQYFHEANAIGSEFTGGVPRFHGLTAGTGLLLGPLMLDVAYLHQVGDYLSISQDETPLPDRVSVRANRVYVSLIYRHRSSP
jgi:hypothetical protein